MSGPGLASVMDGVDSGAVHLGEVSFADACGKFPLGGLTVPDFWSPITEATNLRVNLLTHLADAARDCDLDDDLFADSVDNCVNAQEERGSQRDGEKLPALR